MPRKQPTITDLKPDPNNARVHGERNREMVEASISRDGFGRSVLLANDGTIIAGNATYEAATAVGLDDVVIVETDGKKIIAVKRTDVEPGSPEFLNLAISDNRAAELAEWNTDVLQALDNDLSAWWFVDELDGLFAKDEPQPEPLTDPDAVPEPPTIPITKPGELILLGDHRLLCGDARDGDAVHRLMGNDMADMVWTDPPYGVDVAGKNRLLDSMNPGPSNRVTRDMNNDALDEDGLRDLLRVAFPNAVSVSRKGAVWQVAAPPGPLHIIFGDELHRIGVFRQTIMWIKNNSTFSPLGVDYHWQHEPIYHGWVPGKKHSYYGDRTQTTVWEIDRPTKSADHPTMKPVALVQRSLENHTRPGHIVFDPFGGSGTTMITSEMMGRKSRLMEIDPIYCDVIIRRWEELTGKTAQRNPAE